MPAGAREVAYIGGEGDDLAALGFHELRGLVEFSPRPVGIVHGGDVGADVNRQDVSTFPGESDGVRPPLTACSASDECDLAL